MPWTTPSPSLRRRLWRCSPRRSSSVGEAASPSPSRRRPYRGGTPPRPRWRSRKRSPGARVRSSARYAGRRIRPGSALSSIIVTPAAFSAAGSATGAMWRLETWRTTLRGCGRWPTISSAQRRLAHRKALNFLLFFGTQDPRGSPPVLAERRTPTWDSVPRTAWGPPGLRTPCEALRAARGASLGLCS